METLDLQTQWMSVIKTRSPGSLSGIETMALWDSFSEPLMSLLCPMLMFTS